jgi:hypothetical protein
MSFSTQHGIRSTSRWLVGNSYILGLSKPALACQYPMLTSTCDTLRIHAFWQFYRYETDISSFSGVQKYRYVGGIWIENALANRLVGRASFFP